MKKIFVRSLFVLVVLLVVAVVAVGFFLGSIVKAGVETVGPQIVKVAINLDSVSLSLMGGSCKIRGLVVGNPEGYKAPQAISVGLASVAVSPASLLSDKVVVRSIRVESPEITFEGGPIRNNLNTILDNVKEAAGGGSASQDKSRQAAAPGKKLQVDDLLITGAKAHIGSGPAISLPDIRLSNLGQGADGITAAELTEHVLSAVVRGTLKALAGSAVDDLGNGAAEAGKDAAKSVEKAIKRIGDQFKKK